MQHLQTTVLSPGVLLLIGLMVFPSCDKVKEALEAAKGKTEVCADNGNVVANSVSGKITVTIGRKKYQLKPNLTAKLKLGPLVKQIDQPTACASKNRLSKNHSAHFGVLLFQKGKPVMTLKSHGLEWKRGRAIKPIVSGHFVVPGTKEPQSIQLTSGSLGADLDNGVLTLDFNGLSSNLPFPGEKFSISISGTLKFELGS